jgi:hypothetical protein
LEEALLAKWKPYIAKNPDAECPLDDDTFECYKFGIDYQKSIKVSDCSMYMTIGDHIDRIISEPFYDYHADGLPKNNDEIAKYTDDILRRLASVKVGMMREKIMITSAQASIFENMLFERFKKRRNILLETNKEVKVVEAAQEEVDGKSHIGG